MDIQAFNKFTWIFRPVQLALGVFHLVLFHIVDEVALVVDKAMVLHYSLAYYKFNYPVFVFV